MDSRKFPSSGGKGPRNRRRFVRGLGAVGLVGTAGCTELLNDEGDDEEPSSDDEDSSADADDDPRPAAFEVDDVDPDAIEVEYGDSFDVSATVVNMGDEAGTQEVTVRVDDLPLDSKALELESGASDVVAFDGVETEPLEPDAFELRVVTDDDEETGELVVLERPYSVENVPEERVEVTGPQGPVARYEYAFDEDRFDPNGLDDVSKTYLNVIDPLTEEAITQDTDQTDDHQRGIYVAWGCLTVDGEQHDFWHMDSGELIVHRDFDGSLEAFPAAQTIRSVNEWITPDETVALREEREMTFVEPRTDDGIVGIDFETTFEAAESVVELDFCHGFDDPNDEPYGGVRWRAHSDVTDDGSAAFHFPESAFPDDDPSVMEIREKQGMPWAVQTFPYDGTQYVVQGMDHPDNEFDTRWSAYRSYGLFGPFFEGTLLPDESLTAKFGFSISRGDLPPEADLQSTREAYVDRA